MSKFTVKNLPPIKLVDLLKKRKTNLRDFIKLSGIVTYVTFEAKCKSMGVSPPTEIEFKKIVGQYASSPQEGIIVLDPPTLLKDSGEKINILEMNDCSNTNIKSSIDDISTLTIVQDVTSEIVESTSKHSIEIATKKVLKKKREVISEES